MTRRNDRALARRQDPRHREHRIHGRLVDVWNETLGSTLSADAAAGDNVLAVDDIAAFDDDGGFLRIGGTSGQVIEYTGTTEDDDSDKGTILLAAALDVSAEEDDDIDVWNDFYDMVDTVQYALVAVEGDDDNEETIDATVADGLNLVTGQRGRVAETVVLERDGDEWEIIRVKGRPAEAGANGGIRFEADDVRTITSGDVAAGVATVQLSHRPIDESLVLFFGIPQEPTRYTVNYAARTVTVPLDGWEPAGERIWVHYAYLQGVLTPGAADTEPISHVGTITRSYVDFTSLPLPAGTQDGDLLVLSMVGGTVSCTDGRMTRRLDYTIPTSVSPGGVWTGVANGSGDDLGAVLTRTGTGSSAAVLSVFRGVSEITAIETVTTTDPGAGAVPSVDARFAILAAFAGFGVVDGPIVGPTEYAIAGQSAGTGKSVAEIDYWQGDAPSPAGVVGVSGSFRGLGLAVIGVD